MQTQAQRLIIGSHFNVGNIQMARYCIKSNGHNAMCIREECVPSMKSEAHWVMCVVDLTIKKFVPAPISRRRCPASLGGCSHLRAEHTIFCTIQQVLKKQLLCADTQPLTQHDVTQLFVPAMQNMKKIPIPFSHAFHYDNTDKEWKRLKRMRENELRQRSANLHSVLMGINAEFHVPDSDSGKDDASCNDDSSDKGSRSKSEDDWDEEDLLNLVEDANELITDDDANDVIETELDSNVGIGSSDVKICKFVEKTMS